MLLRDLFEYKDLDADEYYKQVFDKVMPFVKDLVNSGTEYYEAIQIAKQKFGDMPVSVLSKNIEQGLNESHGSEIAIFNDPEDGSEIKIYKRGSGYYGDTGDFDFSANNLQELIQKLQGWGININRPVFGSLDESCDETVEEGLGKKIKQGASAVKNWAKDEMSATGMDAHLYTDDQRSRARKDSKKRWKKHDKDFNKENKWLTGRPNPSQKTFTNREFPGEYKQKAKEFADEMRAQGRTPKFLTNFDIGSVIVLYNEEPLEEDLEQHGYKMIDAVQALLGVEDFRAKSIVELIQDYHPKFYKIVQVLEDDNARELLEMLQVAIKNYRHSDVKAEPVTMESLSEDELEEGMFNRMFNLPKITKDKTKKGWDRYFGEHNGRKFTISLEGYWNKDGSSAYVADFDDEQNYDVGVGKSPKKALEDLLNKESDELEEGMAWAKSGNKVVRKFRCAGGPRHGRVVSKPAQCFAPPDMKKRIKLKQTKAKQGKKMARKRKKTMRTNAASKRVQAMNKSGKK